MCSGSSMSSPHSFPILDFLLYSWIEKMFTSLGFVIFTLYDSGLWVTVTAYSAVLNVFTVDRYLRVYE
jgi:hypothetical protein